MGVLIAVVALGVDAATDRVAILVGDHVGDLRLDELDVVHRLDRLVEVLETVDCTDIDVIDRDLCIVVRIHHVVGLLE